MKTSKLIILIIVLILFSLVFLDLSESQPGGIPFEQIKFSHFIPLENIHQRYPVASLSPDGKKIAFLSYEEICIYEIAIQSNDCIYFSNAIDPSLPGNGNWSPDSRYIALNDNNVKMFKSLDSDIYVFDTEEKKLVNLTFDDYSGELFSEDHFTESDYFIRWTNESELCFFRFITENNNSQVLLNSINLQTLELNIIQQLATDNLPLFSALTNDGKVLVYDALFYSTKIGDFLIQEFPDEPRKLLDEHLGIYFPAFTADSKKVVFAPTWYHSNLFPSLIITYDIETKTLIKHEREGDNSLLLVSLYTDSTGVIVIEEDLELFTLFAIDFIGNKKLMESFKDQIKFPRIDSLYATWSEENTVLVYNDTENQYLLMKFDQK